VGPVVFRGATVELPQVQARQLGPGWPLQRYGEASYGGPPTTVALAAPDGVRRARLLYALIAVAVAILLIAVAFLIPEINGVTDRTGPGGSKTDAIGADGIAQPAVAISTPSTVVSPSSTVDARSPTPKPSVTRSTANAAPPPATSTPPPGPPTYQVPVGTMTPQFQDGTCVYRVQFGNVSSTGYGKLRFYNGACGGTTVQVAALRTGLVLTYEAAKGQETSVVSDTCGSAYEEQATSNPDPAYGVGVRITFGETGHVIVFMDGHGQTPPVVRTC
jgi:hypothetical protein